MKKVLLSWSSGKDSAWALHVLRQQTEIEVIGLFSTYNEEYDRVAMHAVRLELVKLQAKHVGLPIQLIPIPNQCTNEEYAAIMGGFIEEVNQQGVDQIAFCDLFLEDVRKYREGSLQGTGITPIFPTWGIPTDKLAQEMVKSGLRAQITCVDPKQLSPDFSGQEYNASFIEKLPSNVDPCGENGEFHSFAFAGPMFEKPVPITVGETVTRGGFVFTDLLPD